MHTRKITKMHMGKTGNKLNVTAYEVEYSYSFNSYTYQGKDIIPNTLKHLDFLIGLEKNPSLNITIRYNPKHPQQSLIKTY